MKKIKNIIYVTLLVCLLTSCISVRKNNVPDIQDSQLKASSTKKSKVFLDWNFYSNISKQSVVDQLKSSHKKILSEVIDESNCCEIVSEQDEADVVIHGGYYAKSNYTALVFAAITGFSLYTIPSWMNEDMKISAEAVKNKTTKNYVLEDSMFMAQWLPFILAAPFNGNAIKKESLTQRNLYKNLVVEMKNDKIL